MRAARARFTGVSERTAEGTFVASLRVEGKTLKLGSWLRELDAAIAFDRAALWFGRDGSLNLPSESRALGPCAPEDLRRISLSERKRARGSSSRYGHSLKSVVASRKGPLLALMDRRSHPGGGSLCAAAARNARRLSASP